MQSAEEEPGEHEQVIKEVCCITSIAGVLGMALHF
jgi:hypothetical protein